MQDGRQITSFRDTAHNDCFVASANRGGQGVSSVPAERWLAQRAHCLVQGQSGHYGTPELADDAHDSQLAQWRLKVILDSVDALEPCLWLDAVQQGILGTRTVV